MKTVFFAVPLLALACCSKAPDGSSGVSNSVANDSASPGGIALTAAPGVAFSYRYAFSLPPARIAAAQEAHAQACEKLGIARCRITGMRYRLIGENDIEAMLAFKLDPAIARDFGKSGVATIKAADGTLTDAEISGTDAGAAAAQAETESAQAKSDRQRIERELAGKGLSGNERAELQSQRADASHAAAVAADTAAVQRESLASTPMEFDYTSGAAVRGFDASAPVKSSLDTLVSSAQTTFAVLLGAIALLGPPGLVVLLGWLAVRTIRRRWPRSSRPERTPTD